MHEMKRIKNILIHYQNWEICLVTGKTRHKIVSIEGLTTSTNNLNRSIAKHSAVQGHLELS